MKKITESLSDLIEQIGEAKQETSSLKGSRSEAVKRLGEEYNLTPVSAEKWLKDTDKKIDKEEEGIKEDFEALKERYEW